MSYFRKFGSFCAGLAGFIMLIYLFRIFMSFEPMAEDTGILEKVKEFLSPEGHYDNRLAAVLAVMLVLCVAVGAVFKRLPFVGSAFSLPPLLLAVDMVRDSYIKEYSMLCLLLLEICFVSSVWECVRLDRGDGKHRAALCADILTVGFTVYLWKLYKLAKMYEKADFSVYDENGAEIFTQPFDAEILAAEPMELKIFTALFIACALIIAASILFRDAYFISAALTLVPTAALVYFWSAGKITFHEEVIVTFALSLLTARAIPMLSGKVTTKKAVA